MIHVARALAALLILTGFGSVSWADKIGAEFQIHKTEDSAQVQPAVAELADGGFVVVWASDVQDGSGWGVFGQRYDESGARVGKREFRVNKTTESNQEHQSVAGLPNGGFIVTWASLDQDGSFYNIYAQRYNASGKKVGRREFQVNQYSANNQNRPGVTALANGGFVIVWQSFGQDDNNYGVYGQRYNATGKRRGPREFRINETTMLEQGPASVAGLADGGFVVAWESQGQDGDADGIFGQRYDKKGKMVGSREFQVNKTTEFAQQYPSVSGLAKGGFVIAWASFLQDGSSYGVYAQRYNAAGKARGKREFRVNKTTNDNQRIPSVADLADGGFVIVWQSNGQDGSANGNYGQRYNAGGKRRGAREFLINTRTVKAQDLPTVAGLTGGDFVVTWESIGQDSDGWGVYGQRFGP